MKIVTNNPVDQDNETLATNAAGKQTPRRMRRAADFTMR